jgi:hypothetical protein
MARILCSTIGASLIFAGSMLGLSTSAQAQVNLEIGPGGVRTYEERPQVERRVIERRAPGRRVVVEEDDDEVCETRTRRVRVNGVLRTRRVTECN